MAEETKRKPGRPKGVKVVEQRLVKYTLNIGEAARNNIPATLILQFHTMRVAGINPKWILNKDNWPVGIEPDPSPLAQSPTSTEKADSLKFITAYGWGQPVQSTQVEIDIRHRLDQMGSGASNRELEGAYSPEALKYLSQALRAVGRLPAPSDEIIDAEWTETSEKPNENAGLSENSTSINENNPLPGDDSGESNTQ